jgi:peptide/nickel transport system substrate-binding protein
MKRIHLLFVVCLVTVTLLSVACQSTATKPPTTAPTTASTTAPTAKPTTSPPTTTAQTTQAPGVPKYGGMVSITSSTDITGFDLSSSPTNGATQPLTNGTLLGGDWARGPAGSNDVTWTNMGYYGVAFERGSLAESWEIPEVGTVIFHIRPGVRFALDPNNEASRLMNGREFTADDVIFNFTRACTFPTSFVKITQPVLARSSTFTKKDKYTVVMKNAEDPYTGFLLFAMGIGTRQMAPEVIQKYGSQLDWRNSAGTGPFILTDFVSGSQATLKRNPNYWDKDPVGPGKGNQLPYLDSVKFFIIPDVSTQLAAIRTAKTDLAPLLTADDAKSLIKSNPELKYLRTITDQPNILAMRTDKADLPFKDKKVRQALMMATDFELFKTQLYGGEAETLVWPVAVQNAPDLIDPLDKMPQSVQTLYKYNPEGAKKLLAEAGYPSGFKTSVVCSSQASSIDAMSVFKDMWSKVGVSLDIQVREQVVYQSISSARSFTDMYYGMTLGSGVWANMVSFRGTSMFNRSYWDEPTGKDPQVEAVFEDIQKNLFTNDTKARLAYRQLMPYILEQAPVITVPNPYFYMFWQPWVKNYHGEGMVDYSMGNVSTTWMWVDQDLKASATGRR